MKKPTRLEAVCVPVGSPIFHGDIYVGKRAEIPSFQAQHTVDTWMFSHRAVITSGKLGQVREVLSNQSWTELGPGGYWVLRPIFDEENEFGPVTP